MKKAILFVDDDVNLLQGLKRSLRSFLTTWDLYFATSGEEALKYMAESQIEVIVTDLRMPGMDGIQLLEAVSKKYPQTIRFILSGQSDQDMALKATQVAHQVIAKPCDILKLQQTIQHSIQLRSLLTDSNLIKTITGIKKLPSLPSMYVRLMKEMESPDVSTKTLGDIIAQDVTMTAKVLQLVNSAFYSLPSKVTNPQRAVITLGINTLKGLVLCHEVFAEFQGNYNPYFSIDQLWNHSMVVGQLARSITRSMKTEAQMMDEAQTAGVMHDIGKLISLSIPAFYPEHRKLVQTGIPPLEAEYKLLGTSHAELGAYLLGIWGLPDSVVQAVAYHHTPCKQIDPSFSTLTAVHISNSFYSPQPATAVKDPAFPYPVDTDYLKQMNLNGQLNTWTNLFKASMQPAR